MQKTRRPALYAGTVLAVCALDVAMGASSVPISIEAQPIASALSQFVQQSGLQVLFPANDSIQALVAVPVEGTYTPSAALTQLLSNSGLSFEFVNTQTVAIQVASNGALGSRNVSGLRADDDGPHSEPEGGSSTRPGSEKGLPEVLVKGSRALNADIERTPDDIQPYVVLDRKTIERSTAASVNELLRSNLTMSYVPESTDQSAPTLGGGSTSLVALRGLSSTQTLILVDGRRAGIRGIAGQPAQADLNGIPLNAIERIEVLPTTASGIYGGSATGGVVNIVLRHDYTGLETSLKYEDAFRGGGAQRRIDLAGGLTFAGGKTSVMMSGSFSERNKLQVGDRDFYPNFVKRREINRQTFDPAGYLNAGFPILGATTNISSVPLFSPVTGLFTAPNLVLKSGQALGSPITYVSSGYAGVASDGGAAFLQNAGKFNVELANTTQAGAKNASLLNDPSVYFLSATLTQVFTPTVKGFLTFGGSKNIGHFSQINASSYFIIPPNSPSNPFLQTLRVNVPMQLPGSEDFTINNRSARALAGVKVELPKNWGAALEYSFDRNDLRQSFSAVTLSPAARAAMIAGTLNVFSDPSQGSFDLSPYLVASPEALPSHTVLRSASARIAGPVVSLPAGPLVLTALLESNKQSYSEFSQTFTSPTGVFTLSRYSEQASTTKSAYMEAQVPLVSETMDFGTVKSVDLQIAGRYETYSNIGGLRVGASYDPAARPRSKFNSFDPTVGFQVRPFGGVMLRASYGTGFFPPYLSQLNPSPPQLIDGINFGLTDPKRGNQPVGSVLALGGGSTNLRPEKSRNRSLGVVLTPTESTRFSFDWTRINKRDNIASVPLSQDSLDQEDVLEGVITRNTDPATFDGFGVGPIVGFDGSQRNSTKASYESYDLAGSYRLDASSLGIFELTAAATRLLHSRSQIFQAQREREEAGLYYAPEWQANASLTWTRSALSATWTARYLDKMWVLLDHSFSPIQGSDRLPAATYHDVALQYRFGDRGQLPMSLSGASVQFGVKNVFDKEPRFFGQSATTYDPWVSPMLATYYLSVTARF